MICVSYTRSTSNGYGIDTPPNAITMQNDSIKGFLKERGWKLAAKYSDRKLDRENEAAFLQMKQDGMDRKFECVVFSSLFYCGKTLTSATDLLGHVFYPAGLHFAVADDGFCSADVSPEEVQAYIEKVRHEYRAFNSSKNTYRYNPKTIYKKYGYVRVSEEELEIDPEPAQVIREIFGLSRSGKSMKDIADILNERGVESCMAYRRRKTGINYKYGSNGWNASSVSGILENRVYIGEWKRKINGKIKMCSCPPIIDGKNFEETRTAILDRDLAKGKRQKYSGRSLLTRKIVDMETNWPLHVYVLPKDKSNVFRFRYPAPAVRAYETLYLSCETVEQEVERLLREEKDKAEYAKKLLLGEKGNVEKENRMRPLKDAAGSLLSQMMEWEAKIVPLQKELDHEMIEAAEFEKRKQSILKHITELDSDLQKYIDEIGIVEMTFSLKNPWLRHYLGMEEFDILTPEIVKKYVGMVKVFRFVSVHLSPVQEEWFNRLPQSWFKEGEGEKDGEKK